MNNQADFVIDSFTAKSDSEKLELKRKSFTVHPDNWDLSFMGQSNGKNVPDWNRQNQCMRFNHIDKLMLTNMMKKEVEVKFGKSKVPGISYSPHQVANYAFHKFK